MSTKTGAIPRADHLALPSLAVPIIWKEGHINLAQIVNDLTYVVNQSFTSLSYAFLFADPCVLEVS